MFNNMSIGRQINRRWFEVFSMMTTSNMLMKLMALMLVLFASALTSASTSTLAESEINNLKTIETPTILKNDTTAVNQTHLETRQFHFGGFMMPPPPVVPPSLPGCPLCDSSVYSYCSHKLIHDSCCCDFPGGAIYEKPTQCAYYDCTLLYAKSCYEHSLIKNCCCNNPY